jgi:hypothetical protein
MYAVDCTQMVSCAVKRWYLHPYKKMPRAQSPELNNGEALRRIIQGITAGARNKGHYLKRGEKYKAGGII